MSLVVSRACRRTRKKIHPRPQRLSMDAIETRGFNEKKWQSRRTNLFIRIARDESIETKMIVAVAAAALLLLLFSTAATALDPNLDQFSYNDDTVTDDVHNVFGPKDWGEITCPDLENCVSFGMRIASSGTEVMNLFEIALRDLFVDALLRLTLVLL